MNKGGKGDFLGSKVTTSLSYIEFPLVFKYIYYTDMGLSIHPLFGGYLAVGAKTGGRDWRINDFPPPPNTHTKISAFGKDKDGYERFKRFDGGLRIGCGVGFSMFYLDMTYDIGLANISHDDYNSSSNRTFYLNFGVNF